MYKPPLASFVAVRPNRITYNAMISAYGKGKQMTRALAVFDDMHQAKLQPDLITYNALIRACKRDWTRAMAFFEDLKAEGLEPDVVTYNTLIGACRKEGRWSDALQLYSDMQVPQCHGRIRLAGRVRVFLTNRIS